MDASNGRRRLVITEEEDLRGTDGSRRSLGMPETI
jgi:hypothetical protein